MLFRSVIPALAKWASVAGPRLRIDDIGLDMILRSDDRQTTNRVREMQSVQNDAQSRICGLGTVLLPWCGAGAVCACCGAAIGCAAPIWGVGVGDIGLLHRPLLAFCLIVGHAPLIWRKKGQNAGTLRPRLRTC